MANSSFTVSIVDTGGRRDCSIDRARASDCNTNCPADVSNGGFVRRNKRVFGTHDEAIAFVESFADFTCAYDSVTGLSYVSHRCSAMGGGWQEVGWS